MLHSLPKNNAYLASQNNIVMSDGAIHHTNNFGSFSIYSATNTDTNQEHLILVKGDIWDQENVLCRLASECLPGTAFDSADCDCFEQLQYSMKLISKANQGIIIYLRQEGRGHGLATKISALKNKNLGFDTFEAVEKIGLKADIRDYKDAATILKIFHLKSIELLTNNPDKSESLKKDGILIANISNTPSHPTIFTIKHLKAKQKRGHCIITSTDGNLNK